MILRAMKHTKSNMSAARYLGCSYPHYKQYAKLYKNEEGKTLFEAHLNRQGKGISNHLYKKKGFQNNIKGIFVDSGHNPNGIGAAKIKVSFKADKKPEMVSRLIDSYISTMDDNQTKNIETKNNK